MGRWAGAEKEKIDSRIARCIAAARVGWLEEREELRGGRVALANGDGGFDGLVDGNIEHDDDRGIDRVAERLVERGENVSSSATAVTEKPAARRTSSVRSRVSSNPSRRSTRIDRAT